METVFDQAYAAHRAGGPAEAERGYRQALQADCAHVDARHLLGVLCHQQGRHAEAAELIRAALAQRPRDAGLHLNLGNALKAQGALAAALDSFRDALTLAPDFPLAYFNLGNTLQALGRHDEAARALARAQELAPEDAAISNNLGNALAALGEHEAACAAFRRTLALRPGHAGAHNNLGMALNALGRPDAALEQFRAAVAGEARFPAAHFNLGNTLAALGRHAEAAAAFEAALALQPQFTPALLGLGHALAALGRHREARSCFERMLGLDPASVPAWLNLGAAHHALGEHEAAVRAFDEVLRREPGHALAQVQRAVTLLTLRDFARGLPAYEARHALPGAQDWAPLPRWRGEPIGARTLFVPAEQGFGDTVQFARFVPLARARCARLILQVQAPLAPLFEAMANAWDVTVIAAPSDEVGHAAPPDADLVCPLMSLPFALGIGADELGAPRPYLRVPEAAQDGAVAAAGSTAHAHAVPLNAAAIPPVSPRPRRFGLVWSGRIQAQENRALPLAALAPLFALPDVEWVVLQPELTEMDAVALATHPHAARIRRPPAPADFAETAALLDTLDGVVSIDTGVAHLAGALGKPLWLMLPFAADWRWFDGETSPWYPSARLVRQTEPGAWDGVVARVADELAARRYESRTAPTPTVRASTSA